MGHTWAVSTHALAAFGAAAALGAPAVRRGSVATHALAALGAPAALGAQLCAHAQAVFAPAALRRPLRAPTRRLPWRRGSMGALSVLQRPAPAHDTGFATTVRCRDAAHRRGARDSTVTRTPTRAAHGARVLSADYATPRRDHECPGSVPDTPHREHKCPGSRPRGGGQAVPAPGHHTAAGLAGARAPPRCSAYGATHVCLGAPRAA